MDTASLDSYLARRAVLAPYTLFKGIRKLQPGHRLRVGPDGANHLARYWVLPTGTSRQMSEAEAVELVSDGLPRRRRAGPGGRRARGIAAQWRRRQQPDRGAGHRGAGGPIETFSAGFGDERYDELPHAREVSRLVGSIHHEVMVRPDQFSNRWRELTWHRDAPLSEPADVAVYELAARARQSVKVLLSGEGSDELFGGYPKYRMVRYDGLIEAVPASLRTRPLGWAESALPRRAGRARIALRTLAAPTEADRLESWFAPFTAPERQRLLADVETRQVAPDLRGDDPLERMLAFDSAGWLPDNLLERAATAWPWRHQWRSDRRSWITSWSRWPSRCRRP